MASGFARERLVRRPLRTVACLAAFGVMVAVSRLAMADEPADHVYVTLDHAKLLKLPPHVDTIVVGNPSIADVTMIKKDGLMVVTGKGFGETNVIFLDSTGQAISEALITTKTSQTLLTVQRGLDRESYSCAPRCEPAVALGDATKFLSDASGQIGTRNTLVAPH